MSAESSLYHRSHDGIAFFQEKTSGFDHLRSYCIILCANIQVKFQILYFRFTTCPAHEKPKMVLSMLSIRHHYPAHCRCFLFRILNLQLLFLSSRAAPLPCLFCHPEPASCQAGEGSVFCHPEPCPVALPTKDLKTYLHSVLLTNRIVLRFFLSLSGLSGQNDKTI